MIYDKNKGLKFKSVSEEWINLFSSENIHMSVNYILKHKKIQDNIKMTRRHYHLQKKFNTWISRKICYFQEENQKSWFSFSLQYPVRSYLSIGYVPVRRISCSCYACLRKLASPWNIRKYKYNQYWYKGENQQCSYCPVIGPYNNCRIVHCIDNKKTTLIN